MGLQKIISVIFEQDYYPSGLSEGLRFRYDQETMRQMSRLAVKPQFGGHGIDLYTTEDQRIKELSEPVTLIFEVMSDDPYLRVHSELPYDASNTVIYTNTETQSGLLDSDKAVIKTKEGTVMLAQIRLTVKAATLSTDGPREYRVHWPGKGSVWRYYYIGPKNYPAPEVVHEEITFLRHEVTINNTIYQEDKLARNLFKNYPDALHWVFTSNKTVIWKSQPYADISLRRDDETIITSLPNPRQEQNGKYIINALPN